MNRIDLLSFKTVAHFFFLLYIFAAAYFYRERVYFADSAFQLFKIINTGTFNIEAGRYSTFLTQILPISGLKLGLNLKVISILFSVSFPIIYYLSFLFSFYVFKNSESVLLFPIALLCCIRYSFFHPVTETHQAIVYCLLFYSWWQFSFVNEKNRLNVFLNLVVGISLLILALFAHPVSIILSGFLIIEWFVFKINSNDKFERGLEKIFKASLKFWFFLLIILVYCVVKLLTTKGDSYEGNIFNEFYTSAINISTFFRFNSFHFFLGNVIGMYLPLVVLLFSASLFFYLRKANFLLFYYNFAFFVFWFLLIATFRNGDSRMMMEKNFMPLGILCAIAFSHYVIATNYKSIVSFTIYLSILIYSGFGILYSSNFFSQRLDYLNFLIEKTNHLQSRKGLVFAANVNLVQLDAAWAVPFETLLLSSALNKDNATTIFIEKEISISTSEKKSYLLGKTGWLIWNESEINGGYFQLPKTSYSRID